MKKISSALLALLFVLSLTVRADYATAPQKASASKDSANAKPSGYFDPATFDAREYLPNPPADNSAATAHSTSVFPISTD